jgi:hypothetical protein
MKKKAGENNKESCVKSIENSTAKLLQNSYLYYKVRKCHFASANNGQGKYRAFK